MVADYIVIVFSVANFIALLRVIQFLSRVMEKRDPVQHAIVGATTMLKVPVFLSRIKPPTWEARAHGESAHGESEVEALKNLTEKCHDKVKVSMELCSECKKKLKRGPMR